MQLIYYENIGMGCLINHYELLETALPSKAGIITWKSLILMEATTMSDADSIPAVFTPIQQLRNAAKFDDFRYASFTPEEMILWPCNTV